LAGPGPPFGDRRAPTSNIKKMNHFSNSTRKSLGNKKSQQKMHIPMIVIQKRKRIPTSTSTRANFEVKKKNVRLDKISANNVKEKDLNQKFIY
jgi:hypothetical protein